MYVAENKINTASNQITLLTCLTGNGTLPALPKQDELLTVRKVDHRAPMHRLEKSYFGLLLTLATLLLIQLPAFGQQLVNTPEPKLVSAVTVDAPAPKVIAPTANPLLVRPRRPATHEFFDRQNLIAFSAAAALRAADSGYTCAVGVGTTTHNANGSITVHREDMLPVNSCHGVVLMNAAFTGAGLGGSYLMHKMGWHKLERLPNWIVATVPAFGIAYTATHQNERIATTAGK